MRKWSAVMAFLCVLALGCDKLEAEKSTASAEMFIEGAEAAFEEILPPMYVFPECALKPTYFPDYYELATPGFIFADVESYCCTLLNEHGKDFFSFEEALIEYITEHPKADSKKRTIMISYAPEYSHTGQYLHELKKPYEEIYVDPNSNAYRQFLNLSMTFGELPIIGVDLRKMGERWEAAFEIPFVHDFGKTETRWCDAYLVHGYLEDALERFHNSPYNDHINPSVYEKCTYHVLATEADSKVCWYIIVAYNNSILPPADHWEYGNVFTYKGEVISGAS